MGLVRLLLIFLFLICSSPVGAQDNRPILLSQPTSTRAIALEMSAFTTEPFSLRSSVPWNVDQRTRIVLFAINLPLAPGDDLSVVTADAEDGKQHVSNLAVEYVGPVPGEKWISAIVLKLNDELDNAGDVLMRVRFREIASNRVRVAIGHVGDGPPDDPGSGPTPVPSNIYPLSGRVTDQNGAGLADATITMTGPESGVTQTAGDGTYSFIVHTTGNYRLSVSMDQNFYSFSPAAINLPGVNSSRVTNFTGTLSLAAQQSYVLEFDGTPKTVDAGFFWPRNGPLGHFFWEVWAAPGENAGATYMISDGYGGAHALLFGFGFYGACEANRYQLFGDVWDGSTWTFFSSNEGPAVGEWAHLAVGWDGRQIITYFNGVPVGRASFTGPRISPGPNGGAGRLLIGGSDHNNLIGRIAQVRGYEDRNPLESSTTAAFAPEAVFSRDGSYLSYFFRPSLQIADMSNYYRGQAHWSRLRGTLYPYGLLSQCPDCPLPVFVVDPTAPNFLNSPVNNSAPVSSVQPAPSQAIVFDSFSRANSTYTLQNGGLASTEDGSAGALLWQTSEIATRRKPFGILNGRAVVLANERAVAWVQSGSSSGALVVEASRGPGSWGSGYDTGLAFRVIDARNFFFAFTTGGGNDPASARKLTLGYYADGARRDLATNISLPADWTVLGVKTNANGQINVLANGDVFYSVSNSLMSNATGAGLYNDGPGLGLLNRWDNFTVYNTP